MKKRVKKLIAWGLFTLLVMAVSSIFVADRLLPPASGRPSYTLPLSNNQTALDRELVPLLERHPGETGAIMLSDGVDAYAARAISARQAGRSLDLQYYIWRNDLTGRMLANEVWLAAERGVRVRILLDDMGISDMDATLLAMDSHENIELRVYNPFRNRTGVMRLLEMVQRAWGVNHRMHNKSWIADGRVAVVGGRNIGVEYFSAAEEFNFHDLDMVLFGPAVDDANAIFDEFWNSEAAIPIEALNRKPPATIRAVLEHIQEESESEEARRFLDAMDLSPSVRGYFSGALKPIWSKHIQILSDPPIKWRGDDRESWLVEYLLRDIRQAKASVLLISPYFVPGVEGTEGLVAMAERGVDVAVVTNSLAANDVLAVHGGYLRYRKPLLEGGVHLFETRSRADTRGARSLFGSNSSASLHTKATLVDGRHGFVGSFNLDPRSANLNTEMGVMFDDAALGAALFEEFRHLTSPGMSYWVFLDADGRTRWLDRAEDPPVVLTTEPDSTRLQRLIASVVRWLPIESQL
ncbi:phospholipase D family protein [Luteimonas chenhongjianii]|uniref:Phospholipase D family protein n=1 Tax=Luteimonas chenhongjianii TaxID=2006110 RepID=A0A290XIL8_9GAMM|nr:phospholipase D family protein [Luteimonas chenhongjianii]ATD68786.1 phospholipase D family protein [Luteimonas chenhongjianii]